MICWELLSRATGSTRGKSTSSSISPAYATDFILLRADTAYCIVRAFRSLTLASLIGLTVFHSAF